MKKIKFFALIFVSMLLSSVDTFAQYENKVSLNFSVSSFTHMGPSADVGRESYDYYGYYDTYYDDISEEYSYSYTEQSSGFGLSAGLQYNFSSRFSVEGLFRFTYMNYYAYDYADMNSYSYLTEEEYYSGFYNTDDYFEPSYYDHINGEDYTYTGDAGYYAKEYNPYYAHESQSTGEGHFFTFDIGIVPKFYLNPRNKLKFYLFTEAHLNFTTGYEIEFNSSTVYYEQDFDGNLVVSDSDQQREVVTGDQDDVDSEIYFGLIPGVGIDYALGKNLSLYFQGGYSVMDSYQDMMMLQGGIRISAFKSKSL